MPAIFADYAERTDMQRYEILHRTYYNFTTAVQLGPHSLRLRPREGHELRARIGRRLSDKMLTQRLSDLEEQGLVVRSKSGGRGSPSAYRLTPRAQTLRPALQALHDWGSGMAREVGAVVRESPDPQE